MIPPTHTPFELATESLINPYRTCGLGTVKQFIRNVRSAKTIADERAVIQKESAAIRASFREESHDSGVRSANTRHQHL